MRIYYLWNGTIYAQKSGAAMGSLSLAVIANVFMEAFEEDAIKSGKLKPTCWCREVNDIVVIWPLGRETLNNFLLHLSRHQAANW